MNLISLQIILFWTFYVRIALENMLSSTLTRPANVKLETDRLSI